MDVKVKRAIARMQKGETTIELSDHNIGDHGASSIARALKWNKTVSSIYLRNNGIGVEGAIFLGEALRTNSSLTWLNLKNNTLGAEGVRHLSEALKKNDVLTWLDLWSNNIGDEGARHISEFIKATKTLTTLNLRDNDIGSAGIFAIAKALEANDSILSLHLEGFDLKESRRRKKEQVEREAAELKALILENLRKGFKTNYLCVKLMTIGEKRTGKTCVIRSLLGEGQKLKSDLDISFVQVARAHDWVEYQEGNLCGSAFKEKALEVANMELQEKSAKTSLGMGPALKKMKRDAGKSNAPLIEDEFDNSEGLTLSEVEFNKRFPADVILASRYKFKHVSHDPAIRFSIWDFGGPAGVFKTFHHIFLTQEGIYVAVFSLSQVLQEQEKTLTDLCFWLSSVELHVSESATIILIGTHYDEVHDEDLEHIQHVLWERKQVQDSYPVENGSLCFFPLDNTNNSGKREKQINLIREKIEENAREIRLETICIRDMYLMDLLVSINKPFLHFEEVETVAAACGVGREHILKTLRFFHNRGLILFFELEELKKRFVVFQPEWLVLALTRVIHNPCCFHNHLGREINKRQDKELKKEYEIYKSERIVSQSLLEFMWADKKFHGELDYLKCLMESSLLLSLWRRRPDSGNRINSTENNFYFVQNISMDFPESQIFTGSQYDFFIEFEKILPRGVYERLLCIMYLGCIIKWPLQERGKYLVPFGDKGVIIETYSLLTERRLHFCIVHGRKSHSFVSIADQIGNILGEINHDFFHGKLKWVTKLHGADGSRAKSLKALKLAYGISNGNNVIRRPSNTEYRKFDHWFEINRAE